MRVFSGVLIAVAAMVLAGCGGGGGDNAVRNSTFQVAWPARTRDALAVNLSSAQSARVVFTGAGSSGNVTVDINRDRTEAYTGTYTSPGEVFPSRLANMTATFYSDTAQGGVIVGNATATATMTANKIEFATINVTGTITQLTAQGPTLTVGTGTTQLTFTARDQGSAVVPVTRGSATWTIVDGNDFLALTPDGVATPQAAGTAHVRVAVDGVTSAAVAVQVVAPNAVFTWANGRGGNLINEPSFAAVEGNQFKILGTKDVVVTMLGYESDRPTNPGGITAIFNAEGAVIAQAEISSSDTLMDGYYYKAITPLTLTAGSTYYIGSLHSAGSAGTYRTNANTAILPTYIQDLGSSFKVSSTIEGGNWSASGPRHYVGNFRAYQKQ